MKDHMEVEVEEVEVGSLFHDVDLEEQAAALASLDHGNKRCSVAFASCPDLSMQTRVEFIAVDGFGSSDA